MPIDFEYIEEKNILDLKVSGVLKSEEIVEYFQKILDGGFLKPEFIEIVDLNAATDFVLRYSDLNSIADQTLQLNQIGQKVTLMCVYNVKSKDISAMMLPLYKKACFEFLICNSELEKSTYLSKLIE